MKSIIIKQKGEKIIHLKRTKDGVISYILENLKPFIEITVILEDGSRIYFNK